MSERWEDIVDKPFPRFPMEEPVVGREWLLEHNRPPENELQALMEAEPNHEPITPSTQPVDRDAAARMGALLDALTPEELAVIETTVIAGHSIRKAAEILGWHKSTVHRLKQSALLVMQRLEGMEE